MEKSEKWKQAAERFWDSLLNPLSKDEIKMLVKKIWRADAAAGFKIRLDKGKRIW